MEVAHDLVERAFHAEELVLEEPVRLRALITEDTLGARVGLDVDTLRAAIDDHVVHALVREIGEPWVRLDEIQIVKERATPVLLLPFLAIELDKCREIISTLCHDYSIMWLFATMPHPPRGGSTAESIEISLSVKAPQQ